MPFTVKCGLARATCFVVSLACASGFVVAQEIVSANEPGDEGAVILIRPPSDESLLHNVLREAQATQTQGSGAVSTPDPGSQGNFFQRLGKFYAADWTGKLIGSAAPERRALNAPLESPPFPSSDWGYGGSSPIGVKGGVKVDHLGGAKGSH
jgi:hypothetical protein